MFPQKPPEQIYLQNKSLNNISGDFSCNSLHTQREMSSGGHSSSFQNDSLNATENFQFNDAKNVIPQTQRHVGNQLSSGETEQIRSENSVNPFANTFKHVVMTTHSSQSYESTQEHQSFKQSGMDSNRNQQSTNPSPHKQSSHNQFNQEDNEKTISDIQNPSLNFTPQSKRNLSFQGSHVQGLQSARVDYSHNRNDSFDQQIAPLSQNFNVA